jgi:DNA-binding transcriptional LysR family regulator
MPGNVLSCGASDKAALPHGSFAAASSMGDTRRVDAFGEIGVFVRVVETRSFTRASKLLGLTASGVSRVMSRLESRLGVRLLDRTTRSLGLTADGAVYYERCSKILHELEDANVSLAGVRGAPRGRLRVDAPSSVGRHVLGPSLHRFLTAFPELSVDFSTRDHVIDPIAEGVDVVVRMAELRESELVHKKVGSMRMVVVAAPKYLAARGRPKEPRDLRRHDLLGFLAGPSPLPWRFRTAAHEYTLPLTGRLHTNGTDALVHSVVSGLGVAQTLELHVRDELARGRLEIILGDHEPPPRPVYALFARDKATLPKVRAFLEFLEEELRAVSSRVGRSGQRGKVIP